MEGVFNIDNFRNRLRVAFEKAKSNPILVDRLAALEQEMLELGKIKNEQAFKREDEIEKEIFTHSVVVDDLVSFKYVLFEVAELCGEDEDWVVDMLAHENAHANMAQVAKYKVIKYMVLFIKDEDGKLVSIQPSCYFRSDPNLSKIESITKRIAITDAPRVYGNQLSPHDEGELERDRKELAILEMDDPKRKLEIDRIRRELGII